MAEPKVIAVRGAELAVPDLKIANRFYEEVWGLKPVGKKNGSVNLRATGPEHHVLTLHEASDRRLVRVHFAAADRESVDALHNKAKAMGVEIVNAPHVLKGAGGGYGFDFRDKEGRDYTISADVKRHERLDEGPQPTKISHVVLNSADPEGFQAFFTDVLGFKLSDTTHPMGFFRCNADHHSIAYARAKRPGLNHIAYEVPDSTALLQGAGRLKQKGFPTDWGVGRHGPGNNIFAYFVEPNGFVAEYTTEVQQVDDNYPTGTPKDWDNMWAKLGVSMCRWGLATTMTERFRKAGDGDLAPPGWPTQD